MEIVNAIIVAGGSGARFGNKKQFSTLAGEPLIKRTLQAFDIEKIKQIIIVVPEEDIDKTQNIIENRRSNIIVVSGGRTRQASVLKGLKAVSDCSMVLVHDGVRPFVTSDLIDRVITGLSGANGCIPVLPVTDTIKEAHQGFIKKTISRDGIFSVQTPQAFRFKTILKAHEEALSRSYAPTDDSVLIEESGGLVRAVEGELFNIKITTPEDMIIAEAIYAFQNRDRI